MDYILHILINVGIYLILAQSLNLVVGYTGLLSIAHAAFYGLGGYITALIAIHFQSSILANIFYTIILSGIFGFLVGAPALRIHGDYFAIATFGFQIITFNIMNNWIPLTNGPMGISGIQSPEIFGWVVESQWDFLILVLLFCAIIILLSKKIVNAPYGRVLKAIREDENVPQAFGKNVVFLKVPFL